MNWKRLLESASESVNDDLRLRQDYLIAENRILRNQISGRMKLTDSERKELAEIGTRLGTKVLKEVATIATPETILAWHRKFANDKVDTSERPKAVGRPRIDPEIENLVIRMARENRSWGYDRIQGALLHLGYAISDQTVGNILKRHHMPPAPERKKTITWREFIRCHLDVFVAIDFFSSAPWCWLRQIVLFLLSLIRLSRHTLPLTMMSLDQPMLTLQALIHRALGLSLPMQRWAYPTLLWWRSRSEVAFTRLQKPASQKSGKHVVLLAVKPRRVRDGPVRPRARPDAPLRDVDRQAA